jgi:hypothetical protein
MKVPPFLKQSFVILGGVGGDIVSETVKVIWTLSSFICGGRF